MCPFSEWVGRFRPRTENTPLLQKKIGKVRGSTTCLGSHEGRFLAKQPVETKRYEVWKKNFVGFIFEVETDLD